MTLAVEFKQGVHTLTLDRAERGNALNADLVETLIDAIGTAQSDPAVHTLVLRARGANFCTGFDLSSLAEESEGDLLLRFVRIELLLSMVWHSPVRTIACAQGRAWGAGADLFAACDHRVAAPDTTFVFPGAGFGLVLGTRRLGERIGVDEARRCVSEGVKLDAGQALALGLASDLVDGDFEAWLVGRTRAPVVERETLGALRAATRTDCRDADLAALVRSAARPGLKQRILAYRERQQSRGTTTER